MRLDWKYALHLPLAYEGFDYSVLSEFRDRLIEGQAEARIFEKLVEELRGMGLIKERGKQRSDSIAMLVKVRRLSWIEMVVETLRLAVVALVKAHREWCEEVIPPSWEEKYGERFVRQRYSEQEWKAYEANIGNDGAWLLNRLRDGGAPAELQELPEVQVLKTVWAQQFREAQLSLRFGAWKWDERLSLHWQPKTSSAGCLLWNGCQPQASCALVGRPSPPTASPPLEA